MDTLLAQPAGEMRPADAEVKKDYWPEKRKVLQRINQLKQERLRWEDQWIDIRNYQLPFVGDFKRQGDDSYPGRRRD